MTLLLFFLFAATPAIAQIPCPTGTVFIPGGQPQLGDVYVPGFQGVCRRQAPPSIGGQVPRTGQRQGDSTTAPGFTR